MININTNDKVILSILIYQIAFVQTLKTANIEAVSEDDL